MYTYYARLISNTLGYAYPALSTTAKKLDISENTVTKYNEILVAIGLIEIGKGAGRRNNRYYLKRPSSKVLAKYKRSL